MQFRGLQIGSEGVRYDLAMLSSNKDVSRKIWSVQFFM